MSSKMYGGFWTEFKDMAWEVENASSHGINNCPTIQWRSRYFINLLCLFKLLSEHPTYKTEGSFVFERLLGFRKIQYYSIVITINTVDFFIWCLIHSKLIFSWFFWGLLVDPTIIADDRFQNLYALD